MTSSLFNQWLDWRRESGLNRQFRRRGVGAVTTLSKKYRFSVCANRVFGKIFKLGPHDFKKHHRRCIFVSRGQRGVTSLRKFRPSASKIDEQRRRRCLDRKHELVRSLESFRPICALECALESTRSRPNLRSDRKSILWSRPSGRLNEISLGNHTW